MNDNMNKEFGISCKFKSMHVKLKFFKWCILDISVSILKPQHEFSINFDFLFISSWPSNLNKSVDNKNVGLNQSTFDEPFNFMSPTCAFGSLIVWLILLQLAKHQTS